MLCQITDTAIHSLSTVCREMSGRRPYFGLFKISSLLALIPANPDAVKKWFLNGSEYNYAQFHRLDLDL